MKVSVITVCYNSESTLEETIRSVLDQDYNDLEYIVIDGGSTDGTRAILDKYNNAIDIVVSEKDKGLYDAINKGIDLASGELIALLHSDDLYAYTSVIRDVVTKLKEDGVESVYGDLQYVLRNDTTKVTRNWISGDYNRLNFLKGWMPPHPSFFVLKSCYLRYGKFNLDFHSAADYELMLRFLYKHGVTSGYLNKVLVKMRVGGKSNQTIWNRIKANREDKRAWLVNELKPAWTTFIRKPLSKLSQFISK